MARNIKQIELDWFINDFVNANIEPKLLKSAICNIRYTNFQNSNILHII